VAPDIEGWCKGKPFRIRPSTTPPVQPHSKGILSGHPPQPAVTLNGTPTVNVGSLPAVTVAGTPAVNISSPVTVGNPATNPVLTSEAGKAPYSASCVGGGSNPGAVSNH